MKKLLIITLLSMSSLSLMGMEWSGEESSEEVVALPFGEVYNYIFRRYPESQPRRQMMWHMLTEEIKSGAVFYDDLERAARYIDRLASKGKQFSRRRLDPVVVNLIMQERQRQAAQAKPPLVGQTRPLPRRPRPLPSRPSKSLPMTPQQQREAKKRELAMRRKQAKKLKFSDIYDQVFNRYQFSGITNAVWNSLADRINKKNVTQEFLDSQFAIFDSRAAGSNEVPLNPDIRVRISQERKRREIMRQRGLLGEDDGW